MSEETELAWAAGFFDGEGCIWARKPQKHSRSKVYLGVNQIDNRPLERFMKAVGAGHMKGPYLANRTGPSKGNEKPVWYWNCYPQEEVEKVLAKLFPYMSEPKKEQAMTCYLKKAEYNAQYVSKRNYNDMDR